MLLTDQTEYPKYWLRPFTNEFAPGLVYIVYAPGENPRYLHPAFIKDRPALSNEFLCESALATGIADGLGANSPAAQTPVRIDRQGVVNWFKTLLPSRPWPNFVDPAVARFVEEALSEDAA